MEGVRQNGSDTGHAPGRGGCLGVTPLEALTIVEHLRRYQGRLELSAIRKRLISLGERFAGLSLPQRAEVRLPCGLFDPGLSGCVAQASRPLACAAGPCRGEVEHDTCSGRRNAPAGHEPPSLASDYAASLAAAIRSRLSDRLDMNLYELNSAVLRALNCRDAMARWLNGEDIFQGCLCLEATGPPRVKHMAQPVAVHGPHALPPPTRQRPTPRREDGEVDL